MILALNQIHYVIVHSGSVQGCAEFDRLKRCFEWAQGPYQFRLLTLEPLLLTYNVGLVSTIEIDFLNAFFGYFFLRETLKKASTAVVEDPETLREVLFTASRNNASAYQELVVVSAIMNAAYVLLVRVKLT